MEKTIKIGDKEVRLSNSAGWIITYKEQFNQDIIPTVMPLIAGIFDVVAGVLRETGKSSEIKLGEILQVLDGNTIMDAFIHLSGLELTDFINIIWCMAKEVDGDIPEPKKWIRTFTVFPLDEIVPKVSNLIFKGLVSSKNQKRLKRMLKEAGNDLQPKNQSPQTTSSSQASSED